MTNMNAPGESVSTIARRLSMPSCVCFFLAVFLAIASNAGGMPAYSQEVPSLPVATETVDANQETPGLQETAATAPTGATAVTATTTAAAPQGDASARIAPQNLNHPEARFLAGMREELAVNLREITRTLAQVSPEDVQLTQLLRADQNAIIEQIKSVDAQIKSLEANAAGFSGASSRVPGITPQTGHSDYSRYPGAMPGRSLQDIPVTPPAPVDPMMPGVVSPWTTPVVADDGARARQVLETVKQLRELGLDDHADQLMKQHEAEENARKATRVAPPANSTPPQPAAYFGFDTGTPEPPGGLWSAPPSREVVELRETVGALRSEIEQMRSEIKSLETQIRLLNQNMLLREGNSPNSPALFPVTPGNAPPQIR